VKKSNRRGETARREWRKEKVSWHRKRNEEKKEKQAEEDSHQMEYVTKRTTKRAMKTGTEIRQANDFL